MILMKIQNLRNNKFYFAIFKYLFSSINNNYKKEEEQIFEKSLKNLHPPSMKNYQKNCIEHEYFIFKSLSF
jgi:hypothetical protein